MLLPHTAHEAHAYHLTLACRDLREAAMMIDSCYCAIIAGREKHDLFELAGRAVAATGSARHHLDELLACLASEKRRRLGDGDKEGKP
jgi:hypothetical protein